MANWEDIRIEGLSDYERTHLDMEEDDAVEENIAACIKEYLDAVDLKLDIEAGIYERHLSALMHYLIARRESGWEF